jgi:hypothetical protein
MRAKEEVVIGLPMGHVLESTLESTKREVIVSSGIGPPTPCFSLGLASGDGIVYREVVIL